MLQEENKVAVAMSKTADERFAQATDGRSLRNILINCSDTSPLLFVLSQFESSLLSSMPHWDSENVANGMAINRMNTLIETVQKLTQLKVYQSTALYCAKLHWPAGWWVRCLNFLRCLMLFRS